MTEETKELLRQDVLPVVLGNGIAAHRLSSHLMDRYGVASVLCGVRKNLLDCFDPTSSFLHLSRKGASRLTAEQLIDFAEIHSDCLLLLVPLNDTDRAFVSEQSERLEAHFVCAEPRELCGAWLYTLKFNC